MRAQKRVTQWGCWRWAELFLEEGGVRGNSTVCVSSKPVMFATLPGRRHLSRAPRDDAKSEILKQEINIQERVSCPPKLRAPVVAWKPSPRPGVTSQPRHWGILAQLLKGDRSHTQAWRLDSSVESELAVGGERGEGEENGCSLQERGTSWPGFHSRNPALTPGGLTDLQTEPYAGFLEAWEHLEAKAPVRQAGEHRGFLHANPSCTGFDGEGKSETQNSQPYPHPDPANLAVPQAVGWEVERAAQPRLGYKYLPKHLPRVGPALAAAAEAKESEALSELTSRKNRKRQQNNCDTRVGRVLTGGTRGPEEDVRGGRAGCLQAPWERLHGLVAALQSRRFLQQFSKYFHLHLRLIKPQYLPEGTELEPQGW